MKQTIDSRRPSTRPMDAGTVAARIWFGGIAVVVGAALVIQLVLVLTGGPAGGRTRSLTST